MIGQTWERRMIPADSKEFIALWSLRVDNQQVSKLYNNGGVGTESTNRIIRINTKGTDYKYTTVSYEIGIQIIQLTTGCITQGWHSVWPQARRKSGFESKEGELQIELGED